MVGKFGQSRTLADLPDHLEAASCGNLSALGKIELQAFLNSLGRHIW
jgi:hypothetical protein